jgi:hypothetical protein
VTGTVANNVYATVATAYLPYDEPNLINRLVGFLEYTKALENFDQLEALANHDEMLAIDEFIKSEPEFTVYTNLSRRLEQGRSTLAEKPAMPGDEFSRKGFRWVTALARVEVAAMLAGFTGHPSPFAAVAGKGYDVVEYKEMIIDGAKFHFWSLSRDPEFVDLLTRFRPSGLTLAYVRRLNVATAFVFATTGVAGMELSPPQQAEVRAYVKNLGGARESLLGAIQAYLNSMAASKAKNLEFQQELVELCKNGVCRQFGDAGAANPGANNPPVNNPPAGGKK